MILELIASLALAQQARGTPLLTKDLAPIAAHPEGVMLTVEFAPGSESAEHRHNAHTFVYVLEGSLEMQVRGGKRVTLKPGDTFYESPSDIHSVSKNASQTEKAKILVFFVKEKGAAASEPVPGAVKK